MPWGHAGPEGKQRQGHSARADRGREEGDEQGHESRLATQEGRDASAGRQGRQERRQEGGG